jgi:hypothetical protein
VDSAKACSMDVLIEKRFFDAALRIPPPDPIDGLYAKELRCVGRNVLLLGWLSLKVLFLACVIPRGLYRRFRLVLCPIWISSLNRDCSKYTIDR